MSRTTIPRLRNATQADAVGTLLFSFQLVAQLSSCNPDRGRKEIDAFISVISSAVSKTATVRKVAKWKERRREARLAALVYDAAARRLPKNPQSEDRREKRRIANRRLTNESRIEKYSFSSPRRLKVVVVVCLVTTTGGEIKAEQKDQRLDTAGRSDYIISIWLLSYRHRKTQRESQRGFVATANTLLLTRRCLKGRRFQRHRVHLTSVQTGRDGSAAFKNNNKKHSF